MNIYTCAVCGGEYNEDEVLSTTCDECGLRVCIYCVSGEEKSEICDKCVDEKMFEN